MFEVLPSGIASTSDENHNTKAFLGFFSTSSTLLTVFFRSWFSFMVRTIDMMTSSTGLKDLSLFLEWLDELDVGVMPEGSASSSSCCEGCEVCEVRGGCDAVGSAGSSSEAAVSSTSVAGGGKNRMMDLRRHNKKGKLN